MIAPFSRPPGLIRNVAVALVGGAGVLSVGALIAVAISVLGPAPIVVLPIAAAIAMALVLDPFWPLFLLVLSVPVDALFNRIFDPLPVSASTALTLLTLGALLLRLPREPRAERILPDDPTLRWALMFTVVLAISTILAEHRSPAIEDAGRIGGQLLMMLFIVRIVQTPRQMNILIFGLVAATLFSAAVLIFESKTGMRLLSRTGSGADFEGITRSRGASDQNPTTAALMQVCGVTMALVLGLNHAKARVLTLGTGLIGTVGIIYSYARSAALTLFAVGMLIAWRHRRGRYFPLAVLAVVVGVAGALPMVPDAFWDRLSALRNFDTDRTLWRRVGYHVIGVDVVSKFPLFGAGPGNFPQLYIESEYRYVPGRTLEPRRLHNMYLGIAAEMGLIGLAAFLGLIGSAMTRLSRAMAQSTDAGAKAIAAALLYASVAYYLGSLVTPAQYVKFTWVLVGLAVVQARLMTPRDHH